MTDLEYMDRAEALLRAIEAECDRINDTSDADIDNQRVGGMITLAFPDRSQIVVNLQKPLQEVWLAARAGGYHFKHDGTTWRDSRTGAPFGEVFNAQASDHAGRALAFEL